MARIGSALLGPEGLWAVISLLTLVCAAWNHPSTFDRLFLVIPFLGIPLTFLTNYLPGGGGWWWPPPLPRVAWTITTPAMLSCCWQQSTSSLWDWLSWFPVRLSWLSLSCGAAAEISDINRVSRGLLPGTIRLHYGLVH